MKKTLLLLIVCSFCTHLMAQNTKEKQVETQNEAPPPPPPPPPHPEPPPPPQAQHVKFTPPVIVNDKGYNLSVHYNKGNELVYAKKNGLSEKISLDKWLANRSFYEKKYGELPPPPPPLPPPPPDKN